MFLIVTSGNDFGGNITILIEIAPNRPFHFTEEKMKTLTWKTKDPDWAPRS